MKLYGLVRQNTRVQMRCIFRLFLLTTSPPIITYPARRFVRYLLKNLLILSSGTSFISRKSMKILDGWQHLEPRDQRVLIIGTLVTLGLLGYFLLWQPFNTARHELRNRVTAQQATLLWMQNAAQHIQQLRATRSEATPKIPLLTTVTNSLQTGNFAKLLKQVESKNEQEVRVIFEQINFTELMTWLATLHNQFSIQVQSIHITTLTVAEMVKVQLILSY